MTSPVDHWRRRSLELRAVRVSGRQLDAGGLMTAAIAADVRRELGLHGALHVVNTGLASVERLVELLPALGFGEAARFELGGRTSRATQQKWIAPGLRRLDYYPPELHLLANNEVQYRRSSPRHVLFACLEAPAEGGRALLHPAAAVERALRETAPQLLDRMLRHGFSIETGYLDAAHPEKASNTFQSWQERFGTADADEALRRARTETDDFDACWWGEARTLMTRITISARWPDERGTMHLRLPRVALDAPTARNGFRRFPLGNGDALTPAEEALVREALLSTAEGLALHQGDLVLFDNLRFGHSRESFTGTRHVLVGMAGETWDPALRPTPIVRRSAPAEQLADDRGSYAFPPALVRRSQRFSARVFDAGGRLDDATAAAVWREFSRHGAVHVQNTGVTADDAGALPEPILRALHFGGEAAFPWGGMSSGRTTRRQLSRELRATDQYPAHLWLLPHNEVLYQRSMPARLLFFSAGRLAEAEGGRTFVHSAKLLEQTLRELGGGALLDELRRCGLLIEMGFVDDGHPERHLNFFRSWQERFDTGDRTEAERRCRASTHQFDECWWRDEGGGHATLMTRIRVPAYCDGHLLFPRVALDEPSVRNGHRRYPRGDGVAFSRLELDLLLHAFLETREGVAWSAGDVLLVDNVRYGHSREAYSGPRTLGVAMAGVVDVGPPP
ncbi:MAG: TauD/TfdA family dioxygenase [Myxococcaceae bacterium]|nr:TauD/TfdA family dioxygenase [Myxococcaceae bacterium]